MWLCACVKLAIEQVLDFPRFFFSLRRLAALPLVFVSGVPACCFAFILSLSVVFVPTESLSLKANAQTAASAH
jgi:hypothetical protein